MHGPPKRSDGPGTRQNRRVQRGIKARSKLLGDAILATGGAIMATYYARGLFLFYYFEDVKDEKRNNITEKCHL